MLAAHIDSPRLSAQVLLAHVLDIERLPMLLDRSEPVPKEAIVRFESLAARRCAGEPIAYLVGYKEFYSRLFAVSPDVLIPRPETEGLIDLLQKLVSPECDVVCADVGTGSGILAVTAALSLPRARVVATDTSFAALNVARSNALRHNVASRVSFVHTSLLDGLDTRHVDVVLANLPYVPDADALLLDREVFEFEPKSALFGGVDGLAVYRELAAAQRGCMKSGAILIAEIDYRQAEVMRALWTPLSTSCEVHKDWAGHDRIVVVVF